MFDSVLGWGFGAVLLALGLGVAWAMGRVLGIGTAAGHNVAVDGLRGYLAFGVLLHHSEHWAVVSGVATVVVSLAAVSYRYLELPAMQRVRPVTARLHRAWLAVRRPRSAPTA